MKMKSKHKYLIYFVLFFVVLLSSMNIAQIRAGMQTSYTPTVGDVATFVGKTIESEKNMGERIVTDDTNETIVDYEYNLEENILIDSITNYTTLVSEVGSYGAGDYYGTNITMEGVHNATGSYFQNITEN